ncbi:MAG: hypothetical protein Q4G42_00970 [Neisseria sp.]|nr:hypothetical protein [Neisseria sp.]
MIIQELDDNFYKKQKKVNDDYLKSEQGKGEFICLHGNCTKPAIGSHFFSRSTLYLLSVDGHVLKPIFDSKSNYGKKGLEQLDKDVSFELVGIKTHHCNFKGFCPEHERLFNSLDKNTEILTLKDLIIQVYRNLCKLMFTNKNNNEAILNSTGLEVDYTKNSISLWAYFLENLLHDTPHLEDKNSCINKIISNPNNKSIFVIGPINKTVKNKPDLVFIYKKTKLSFKLALYGKHIFKKDRADLFFIITPSKKGSDIIAVCPNNYTKNIQSWLEDEIDILCLVENLMILNENWFLSPEIINNWSSEKKNFIEKDLFFHNEFNLNQDYDVSIFDDIRKDLICSGNLTVNRAEKEKQKFTLPKRLDEETRRENLALYQFQQIYNTTRDLE